MVTYRRVGSKHPVCRANEIDCTDSLVREALPTGLPLEAFKTLNRWGMGSVKQAIVATHRKNTVGFLRYEFQRGTFHAYGTWVSIKMRGRSIALSLWIKSLKHFKPKKVIVTTVSRKGQKLVKRLQKMYPKINWVVYR